MAINTAITVTSSVVVTTTTATVSDQPGRQDALVKSLESGAGTSSIGSPEQSRAYLRQMNAVHDAVAAASAKMTFTSGAAARDFTATTEKGLLAALHKGDRPGLTALLQDLPTEALAAASKSLAASETRDANADRLIKSLSDLVTEIKSWRAASGKTSGFGHADSVSNAGPFGKTSFVI